MNTYTVTVNGKSYSVEVKERRGSTITFIVEQQVYTVQVDAPQGLAGHTATASPSTKGPLSRSPSASSASSSISEVRAPLPGIISDIKIRPGDTVKAGDVLLVIEAMKMENPIKSPRDARVKAVHVTKGQEVAHNIVIISFE
jgi:biotin carboxyl carrier protein